MVISIIAAIFFFVEAVNAWGDEEAVVTCASLGGAATFAALIQLFLLLNK